MPFPTTGSQGAGSLQLPLRIWGTGGRGVWDTSVVTEICRPTTCLWYQPSPPAGFGGQARAMRSPRARPCTAQGPVLHGAQLGGSHGAKSKKKPKKSDWICHANLFQKSCARVWFTNSLLFFWSQRWPGLLGQCSFWAKDHMPGEHLHFSLCWGAREAAGLRVSCQDAQWTE